MNEKSCRKSGALRIELKWWQVCVLVLGITAATTLFSIALQPGGLRQSVYDIVSRPLAIPLNVFPVLALILLCYCLCGNILYGSSAASFVALVLSYINLMKIEGREDAFVPADIGLFREAMAAVADYNLDLHLPYVALIIVYCLVLLFAGLILKSPHCGKLVRFGGCVAIAVVFALSMKFVYMNNAVYNSFTVPNPYNIPSVFNTLGFNYCFLRNYALYPVDKPEGYDQDQVLQWEQIYLKEAEEVAKQPNVIIVMGEAFSDISNEEVFRWNSAEENPLYYYNLLAGGNQSIAGHMIVSNIAAGTANTEFDILTGMPTTMIGETTTSSFRVVHKDIPTIASVLGNEGYHTMFMHPGDSWFYNRSSVYKHFGISDQMFRESFDADRMTVDGLVLDDEFYRVLHNRLETMEQPYFIYGVTIQNHQSYFYGKYADVTQPVPIGDISISDSSMEAVSVYMRGARATSEMLWKLTEYVDTLAEPTIVVFFGDHLPNLGENFRAYRELGLSVGESATPEQILSAYEVPFLIYGNEAYCGQVDLQKQTEMLELPEACVINSSYLGAMVLELIGYEGRDAYFDFLNEARRQLPVFRDKESVYMLADGTYTNAIEEALYEKFVKTVDWWEYSRLK